MMNEKIKNRLSWINNLVVKHRVTFSDIIFIICMILMIWLFIIQISQSVSYTKLQKEQQYESRETTGTGETQSERESH